MKIEKITNPYCSRNFEHGATIETESGRHLGATCNAREAEKIIKEYFITEFFPEPVWVFFGGDLEQSGTWGYIFRVVTK